MSRAKRLNKLFLEMNLFFLPDNLEEKVLLNITAYTYIYDSLQ